jgi:hypothetical protein
MNEPVPPSPLSPPPGVLRRLIVLMVKIMYCLTSSFDDKKPAIHTFFRLIHPIFYNAIKHNAGESTHTPNIDVNEKIIFSAFQFERCLIPIFSNKSSVIS